MVPVAATGDCGWCGERALLYFRARDGSDMERPACRPCMEYDCGVPTGIAYEFGS